MISNWIQDQILEGMPLPSALSPMTIEILMKLLDSVFLQDIAKSQCHLLWLLSNKMHHCQQGSVFT